MSHYYDERPETAHDRRRITVQIGNLTLEFNTDSGVFAKNRLDFGTKLLTDTVYADYRTNDSQPHGRLLDLGCGYGVVGITFKRLYPALEVVMTDINERAVELARLNAAANQTRYVDIRQGDGFAAIDQQEKFDLIVTNPPVRAGKKTVYAFFDGSFKHLKPGGRLYVVLQNKQGAPSARQYLKQLFGNCDDIERKAGYHIFRCVRDANQPEN